MRVLIAVLVLFPYLLYRFAVSFRPPSRRLSLLVGSITVLVVAWTLALPDIPEEGESWPWWFALYVAAFTVHWTLLTVVVTWRLWTAGRGEASVPRKRMRLLACASAAITLALLVGVASPSEGSAADLVGTLLTTLAALAFLLGLAPPTVLRVAWRRPEQARLQAAVADLLAGGDSRGGRRGRPPADGGDRRCARGRAARRRRQRARALRRARRPRPASCDRALPVRRDQRLDEPVCAVLRGGRARRPANARRADRTRARPSSPVVARARGACRARAGRRDQDELHLARGARAADAGRDHPRPRRDDPDAPRSSSRTSRSPSSRSSCASRRRG